MILRVQGFGSLPYDPRSLAVPDWSQISAFLETVAKVGIPTILSLVVIVVAGKYAWVKVEAWRAKRGGKHGASNPAEAVGRNSDLQRARRPGSFAHELAIKDHYFFSTVQSLMGFRVKSLNCGCPARTDLLRTMMRVYLEVWKEEMERFCESMKLDPTFDSTSPQDGTSLEGHVNDLLIRVTERYHAEWTQAGVLDPAVKAFDHWHSTIIETLVDHTKRVAASAFYATNRERLIAIMAQMAVITDVVVREARSILKRMNGHLDGLSFDGRVIRPIDQEPEIGTDGALPEKPKKHRSRPDWPGTR